jgi:hypothetical protein
MNAPKMTTPPKRLWRSPQGATLPDRQSRIHGVCMMAISVCFACSFMGPST